MTSNFFKEYAVNKSLEDAIHDRRRVLQNPYAHLAQLEEIDDLKAARRVLQNPQAYAAELDAYRSPVSLFDNMEVKQETPTPIAAPGASQGAKPRPRSRMRADAEIEALAREQHRQIWINRASIFPDHRSRNPIDMLDPTAGLRLLGFEVETHGALGQLVLSDRHAINVAGLIDKQSRKVLLSSGFPLAQRNFTAAHEYGHALMHDFAGMHRDRALDGGVANRDHVEREADKFASYFLMPTRLVTEVFESIFGKAPFVLNEETRFALSGALPHANWRPTSVRDLSRMLSTTDRFNGMSITPLAIRFRVSGDAMAIRLEQLHLVA